MKKIKVIYVALALLATMGVFANKGINIKMEKDLSSQIYEMLKQYPLELKSDDLTAEVRFTINNKGELVVLSVETQNDFLENYVKSRLNYKKVDVGHGGSGKIYKIPVRITA
ncbi:MULTISPECIES: hypothetical protein [Flagellimonas]|uniref:TonB C-terminal domain-containing protein n=1 Tax=Flagellimonas hadalis TaxID=2597517 RepID=A0A5N5J1W6_9FLAO|nr:hypothetical protein [Allomuricauda hadalis]KAB5486907.1 hypothetical protein FOT42_012150 [Allomuricauda hadalis]RUA16074.1 MAG: hypothetical protein DSY83_06345 [Flavobacteriia bacterium]